ncbi:MAG: 4-oxalocrotonate tautomerase [Gammaproteobacteria bacterium]
MPLTITLTEGVLPTGAEKLAVAKITDAMLKWHGLTGNQVMTPNVTATVHVLPRSATFSGGKEFSGAWVEWKVPSFAFNDREIQVGFGRDATNIIHELSNGKQPKENIYVNVVHAVDGTWNLNGEAMTNEQLGAAIAKG